MCQDEAESNNDINADRGGGVGSVMSCLIKKKDFNDMNEKCRAGIEHRQLV